MGKSAEQGGRRRIRGQRMSRLIVGDGMNHGIEGARAMQLLDPHLRLRDIEVVVAFRIT